MAAQARSFSQGGTDDGERTTGDRRRRTDDGGQGTDDRKQTTANSHRCT